MLRLPVWPTRTTSSTESEEADPERVVHRACTLCEACCGVTVRVSGNEILEIRGDPEDPFSRGYICPKALANGDLVRDPDRLRQPQVRDNSAEGGWREAGWTEALDAAADGLAEVVRRHGPDAVAVYIGNAAVHGSGAALMGAELLGILGSRRRYTASSLDQQPQQLANQLMFGNPVVFAVPDIDRTDLLLILGGNPAVSNGSIMTAPDMRRRVARIRARGGRVIVIDPRRTETARLADEHLFVRPGTDALLVLGLIHVLFAEGLVDTADAGAHLRAGDVEVLSEVCRPFGPEAVSGPTGIPADTIRTLARTFAGAPSAVAYGRLGICQTEYGGTAFWLLTCLNILSGNLDRPGGLMFPTPAIDLATILDRFTSMIGYARFRSRIGDFPEVAGDLPTATLADEILTPGPGQIRALVTMGGNPVLSAPGGRRMDEALADLEHMIAIDPFRTESARHASVILPPQVAFERDDVEAVFGSTSVRNMARYSPRAVEPGPDTKDDAAILAGLVERLAQRIGSPAARARGLAVAQLVNRGQLDRLFDLALRSGPYGRWGLGLNLGRVKAAEHGMDLGPLVPSLPKRLFTADRKIALAPAVLVADVDRVQEMLLEDSRETSGDPQAGAGESFDLLLIGRRHLRSNNSWMANSERLVRGAQRCTVLMHPFDAQARGISDGDNVLLTGPAGTIKAPAEVSDEIMSGVVSVPHGWGHGRPGVGWRTAAAHPGVSVNDVIAPRMDPISGNAALQAVPVGMRRVDVTPAAEPQPPSLSWSPTGPRPVPSGSLE